MLEREVMETTDQIRRVTARRPAAALAGSVIVPGDKSISHRALMFAGLAVGETTISGLLEGEDVLRTAAAMRALGAEVTRGADGIWRVWGRGVGGLAEPVNVLDMGNSGTAARLLAGLLATQVGFAVMTGDASLRGRPMARVTQPLSGFGARFACRAGGRLPMAIEGARDPVPVMWRQQVASAQVKSAILLAGLNTPGETVVDEPEPTRDHTENMLRHFGATVRVEAAGLGKIVTLSGYPDLRAADVLVPGDPSSAAFPLAAALLVPGSSITVRGVGLNPLRSGCFEVLREMGALITISAERIAGGEPVGDVTATHGPLTAVDVPGWRVPSMVDEYPIMAVIAACAHGTSRFRGLRELRVKESDRLAATAAMLSGNGVSVSIEGDDLLVHGTGAPPAGGGLVATHMDHRLAMSGLVFGLAAAAPVTVDDVGFIDTSFPGFFDVMTQLGASFGAAA